MSTIRGHYKAGKEGRDRYLVDELHIVQGQRHSKDKIVLAAFLIKTPFSRAFPDKRVSRPFRLRTGILLCRAPRRSAPSWGLLFSSQYMCASEGEKAHGISRIFLRKDGQVACQPQAKAAACTQPSGPKIKTGTLKR